MTKPSWDKIQNFNKGNFFQAISKFLFETGLFENTLRVFLWYKGWTLITWSDNNNNNNNNMIPGQGLNMDYLVRQ